MRNRSNKRCIHSYSLLYGIESNRQSDTQLVVRRSFTSPTQYDVDGRVYLPVCPSVLSVRVTDSRIELSVSESVNE